MKRQDAEKIITEYLGPIFGFALKRCKSVQDAEDLSQEIVLRAFRALLFKDDIDSHAKFIWTVAHNTLNNYYRDSAKSVIGVSIDEVAELLAEKGFDANWGARPLRRTIMRLVEDKLSTDLLEGKFAAGDSVVADVTDGEIVFLKK